MKYVLLNETRSRAFSVSLQANKLQKLIQEIGFSHEIRSKSAIFPKSMGGECQISLLISGATAACSQIPGENLCFILLLDYSKITSKFWLFSKMQSVLFIFQVEYSANIIFLWCRFGFFVCLFLQCMISVKLAEF